jgi:hypothetical protein
MGFTYLLHDVPAESDIQQPGQVLCAMSCSL